MTIEVRPLGVKCNLKCLYCYQNPERDAANAIPPYDLEKMKAKIEKADGNFTLFGGEALMVREKDLEKLWSWGFERYGQNGIQTNGTLINDSHIRMFKKYKVHVGISVDGPGELNDARWNGTLEKTREATAKTHSAIKLLCKENVNVSLIVNLHRGNATQDKLPMIHEWFKQIDDLGITSARLHLLQVETDEIRQKLALSEEETVQALLSFYELSKELNVLKIDIFSDMFNMLLGQDKKVTCVWATCDPYTTSAVQGIEGDGQSSNCSRTSKDGINFVKADVQGFERYLALYHTPQEYGGCQDCRFFLICKGHCPGNAMNGDWRNRTEQCAVLKRLFTHFEKQMLDRGETPLSVSPYREEVEVHMVDGWSKGLKLYVVDILNEIKADNGPNDIAHNDSVHSDHSDH